MRSVVGAPSAWATFGIAVSPNLPPSSDVDQTMLAASLGITNILNGPEAASGITLTSITLVPSCGSQPVVIGD